MRGQTATLLTGIMAMFLMAFSDAALVRREGPDAAVREPVGAGGTIDWTEGVVTAVGNSAPPQKSAGPAEARAMAERSAHAMAMRSLLEAVESVRIDTATSVGDAAARSDVLRTRLNRLVQGSLIVDRKSMPDGAVEITVAALLTGDITDAVMPQGPKTPAQRSMTAGAAPDAAGEIFSGLIIDARGQGIRAALMPKIVNEEGREIYGPAWTGRDLAVREGMAVYLRDLRSAEVHPRAGERPLLVKVLRAAGDGRVDMVIPNSTAAILQGRPENLRVLEACRVIIVVD